MTDKNQEMRCGMNNTTVFICERGRKNKTKKVQLEIRDDVFEWYKTRAKDFQGGKYTAKQIMENILHNNADGVVAGKL